MIRSSAGPCKYLRNYDKKIHAKFLQKKKRKKNSLKVPSFNEENSWKNFVESLS